MIDFAYEAIKDHAEDRDNSKKLELSLTDTLELVAKITELQGANAFYRGMVRGQEMAINQLKTDVAIAYEELAKVQRQKDNLIKQIEAATTDWYFTQNPEANMLH